MIVFFPLHEITKCKKKRYDRSDRFYCCFRNRVVSRCLGILRIENYIRMDAYTTAKKKEIKTRKEELVYASTVSTKSSIILKDSPGLECLGARRAPRNFCSGDQLWGLGALTKMLGSPKGSLKFSLEHSLVISGRRDLDSHRRLQAVQGRMGYGATNPQNCVSLETKF